jgi:hypothetical protein
VKDSEFQAVLATQVDASRAQTDALSRVASALEAPGRAEKRRGLNAAFPPLFRLFGGERGFRALLGMADVADACACVVPASHVEVVLDRARAEHRLVRCVCGSSTLLEVWCPVGCSGACGRWFVDVVSSVRVGTETRA